KAAAVYVLDLPPGGESVLRLRLTECATAVSAVPTVSHGRDGRGTQPTTVGGSRDDRGTQPTEPFADFDAVFADRVAEADAFYAAKIPAELPPEEKAVSRQAYAGLLWSEQFYHYVIPDWVSGDAWLPLAPEVRATRMN